MDKRVYGAVSVGPAVVLLVVSFFLTWYFLKNSHKAIGIVTSVFTKVLYYSVESGKKKLYFLDLQINDRQLATTLGFSLYCTLLTLLSATCHVFLAFLLVEMTYECTEGFDCYKTLSYDNYPVNCETISEDVAVTCYCFAFNPFIATGIGYGVLKVGVAAIYFCSLIILWIYRSFSKAKCICKFLIFIAVLLIIVIFVLIGLNQHFRVISLNDSMKYGFSGFIVVLNFIILACCCPWSQLAKLKSPKEDFRNDSRSTGSTSESVNPQHNLACDEKLDGTSRQVGEEQTQRLKPASDTSVSPQQNKASDEILDAISCELDEEPGQHSKPICDMTVNTKDNKRLRSSHRQIFEELALRTKPAGDRKVTSKHNTACD